MENILLFMFDVIIKAFGIKITAFIFVLLLTVGSLCASILFFMYMKKNWDKLLVLLKIKRKKHTVEEIVDASSNINDMLVELRNNVTPEPHRAYVFEFRNGSKFAADNPVWNIVRTHEKCASGIDYISNNEKIHVSGVLDTIKCYLTGKSDIPGITRVTCSGLCLNPCEHNTYIIEVDKLPWILSKQRMMAQGIKVAFQTSIKDECGSTIGVLSVDYCNNIDINAISHDQCKILVETAERIGYELTQIRKNK